LASANAQTWASAVTDADARARLLATLSRDLKISLRARKTAPQRLLLAGALALGLALRAQFPRGRVNFRKGEFAFTKDLSQLRGKVIRLGVAAAVLLVLGLVLGIARLSSLHRQAAAYDDAVCTATRRILGTCTTDYRQAIGQLSGD